MTSSIPSALIELLRSAQRVTVLTGAGVSAESGIPTFREALTGLWSRYDPEELATPEAFQRNPSLVWGWYQERRRMIAHAQPNPGHFALARMERLVPSFTLVTQNVDNLHRIAGNKNIIELHGNLQRTKCSQENVTVEIWPETDENPPRCPHCGGFLRPDVVWFGEVLPEGALHAAYQASQECQIFFSIGTSSLIYPAASLPYIALERSTPVVEINTQRTELSTSACFVLKGPSGVILPELLQATWPRADIYQIRETP